LTYKWVESKKGPTANVNPNQERVFEEMQRSGGTPVGKNAKRAGLPVDGSWIDPTTVQIDFWD
jgi:hypothetical protein